MGLPSDLLLRHHRQRVVYAVSLVRNLREHLLGIDPKPSYLVPIKDGASGHCTHSCLVARALAAQSNPFRRCSRRGRATHACSSNPARSSCRASAAGRPAAIVHELILTLADVTEDALAVRSSIHWSPWYYPAMTMSTLVAVIRHRRARVKFRRLGRIPRCEGHRPARERSTFSRIRLHRCGLSSVRCRVLVLGR